MNIKKNPTYGRRGCRTCSCYELRLFLGTRRIKILVSGSARFSAVRAVLALFLALATPVRAALALALIGTGIAASGRNIGHVGIKSLHAGPKSNGASCSRSDCGKESVASEGEVTGLVPSVSIIFSDRIDHQILPEGIFEFNWNGLYAARCSFEFLAFGLTDVAGRTAGQDEDSTKNDRNEKKAFGVHEFSLALLLGVAGDWKVHE